MFIYRRIYCRSYLTTITVLLFVIKVYSGTVAGYVTIPAVLDGERLAVSDASKLSINLIPKGAYKKVRENVGLTRQQLRNKFINRVHPVDSLYVIAGKVLEESVVNKLIPFWYGTQWDFNGYSHIPKSGVIACGYFVSTVLLHAGFSLNRYTLAQQAPYFEAVSLQLTDSIRIYKKGFTDFYQNFKKENDEGLYFAGLDNHVGFLLYRNDHLIFIHSSYTPPFCVTIEPADHSAAFTAVRTYYIAEISNNRKLIDRWLNGEKIPVRTASPP
ncbi:MAG: hypothetical protein JW915_15465 [Chitinispirillaceae bacterium]|nr:hypothetical protein [Chitinispirillaceae bacterium]